MAGGGTHGGRWDTWREVAEGRGRPLRPPTLFTLDIPFSELSQVRESEFVDDLMQYVNERTPRELKKKTGVIFWEKIYQTISPGIPD